MEIESKPSTVGNLRSQLAALTKELDRLRAAVEEQRYWVPGRLAPVALSEGRTIAASQEVSGWAITEYRHLVTRLREAAADARKLSDIVSEVLNVPDRTKL